MEGRVIHPNMIGIDPRYINCVGFMLLARDHIALEMGQDVNPSFHIKTIVKDTDDAAPDKGLNEKDGSRTPEMAAAD